MFLQAGLRQLFQGERENSFLGGKSKYVMSSFESNCDLCNGLLLRCFVVNK